MTTLARIGLSRSPVLTVGVTVLTAAISIVGLASPRVLEALARTPAARHGQWWRWIGALFVQDGGWIGTLSNVGFLLVLGAALEQVVGRWRWAACYVVTGLAGEVAGQIWQPFGAGNSVAVCGLAGALAWRAAAPAVPEWARPAMWLWLGALLATWWPPLIALGVVAVLADQRLPDARAARLLLLAATGAVGVTLTLLANIHGVALLVGLLVGVAVPLRPGARDRGR